MDKKEDAENYLDNVMLNEWMPDIHYHASTLQRKYPERIKSPHDLHMAGYMGLLAAVKNWNDEKAKTHNNSFRSYAGRSIKGHMQDHITGIHSFDKEGVVDPHLESQSRQFERAQQVSAAKPESDEPPPIPVTKPDHQS